jgi:hypothetical protein
MSTAGELLDFILAEKRFMVKRPLEERPCRTYEYVGHAVHRGKKNVFKI